MSPMPELGKIDRVIFCGGPHWAFQDQKVLTFHDRSFDVAKTVTRSIFGTGVATVVSIDTIIEIVE
jgi:hypothetical protein